MRILPSGSRALLVELDDLDEVLALYEALSQRPPQGVVDLVPAARTILVLVDPTAGSLESVADVVRHTDFARVDRRAADLLEIPVHYDGEDLPQVAAAGGCDIAEVVRRHASVEWTVAFCGFSAGFGYLTSGGWEWNLPRRASPRTRVPAGAVALAGEFCGIYPRESPGGWQLIGHTDIEVFDLSRDPAALLRPATRVRFTAVSAA
jgi:KipI family sensor histidine kinase inhibitor